jgi:hypothetical protein
VVGAPFRESELNMFDITQTAVGTTAEVLLTNADESPMIGEGGKQCSITVYGPGSAEFERAAAKRQNLLVDRLKRKGKADMSPDEQRAEQAEFLSAITASFNHFTYPPAGEAEGKDLFRALYKDRSVGFITDQVQRFAGDWGNFTKPSATS